MFVEDESSDPHAHCDSDYYCLYYLAVVLANVNVHLVVGLR